MQQQWAGSFSVLAHIAINSDLERNEVTDILSFPILSLYPDTIYKLGEGGG